MRDSCETELEYLTSKYLLFEYLSSDLVTEQCGKDFAEEVRKLIRDHIEPYEQIFVCYQKKGIRHFYEYSNSAHEGTNNGLKHCCGDVEPSHLIEDSSERLSFQGIQFYVMYIKTIAQRVHQTNHRYVNSASNTMLQSLT